MSLINKRRWRIILDYIIGWTFAFVFLTIVRGSGTIEQGSVQWEFSNSLIVSFIFGPIFGAISGGVQVLMEERFYKRTSIQRFLFIRFLYAVAFVIVLILTSYLMVTTLFDTKVGLATFIIEPGSFAIYFYILFVDLFLVSLRQVNLMLGDSNLWKLLRGKFYTPHEEERIFMFLDLQSSTKHAERLGHIQYSRMIQDCFDDLGVVVENEAEIYQYVGDEVILTWRLKDGLKKNNCVNAYFNFKERLVKREKYYLANYGALPFFKAGMNAGVVTVTEVGKYKKEIAYHGDTINTAARIQGQCNAFGAELLISTTLKNQLIENDYSFEKLGIIPLKGKEKEVEIYSVMKSTGS